MLKQLEIFQPKQISHDELAVKAAKYIKKHHKIAIAFVNNWLIYNVEKPDVIGFNRMCDSSLVVEVKISHADFLRDAKKRFRIIPKKGMGMRRYYCCPEGVIKKNELPLGWGLIYYYRDKHMDTVRGALPTSEFNRAAERYLLLYYLRFPEKLAANKI